jgi:hypothetical protein
MATFLSELGTLPEVFSGTLLIDANVPVAATLINTLDGVHSASLPFAQ